MELLWHLVRVCMGLVEVSMFIMLIDVFFVKKIKYRREKIVGQVLIFIVLHIVSLIIPPGFLKYTIVTILCTLLAHYLYQGKYIQLFLTTALYMIMAIFLEEIMVMEFIELQFLDRQDMISMNTYRVLITVGTRSIQFIGINLMRRIRNRNDIRFNWKELLVYVTPCSTIILVGIFIKYQNNNYNPLMQLIGIIIVFIGLLTSNVFIWLMFEHILKQDRHQRQYEKMQEQIKKQYEYYRNIEVRQEESRRMWHDINNHLTCMRQLIHVNNHNEAAEYFNKINITINRLKGNIKTGSVILDAILNDKYEVAQMNNIQLQLNIEALDIGFINSIDICTIYSNLLDNAIEACKKLPTEERAIHVTSKMMQGFVIIKMTNTIKDQVVIKDNRISTTKKDSYHHGIGLMNICETIERYNGNITMECESDKFKTCILLPVS